MATPTTGVAAHPVDPADAVAVADVETDEEWRIWQSGYDCARSNGTVSRGKRIWWAGYIAGLRAEQSPDEYERVEQMRGA